MNRNSDSDEDDSDYAPADDEDVDEQENDTSITLTSMNARQLRKVSSIWDEMKESDAVEMRQKMAKRHIFSSVVSSRAVTKASAGKRKRPSQVQNLLDLIFGVGAAEVDFTSAPSQEDVPTDITNAVKEAVKNLRKRVKVQETRKFAGREITVDIIASSSSSSTSSSAVASAATSALDGVLETLKGPKVISTVSKSSLDWENYKEKEGLDETLAAAAKDGYLTRKDFLERCDYRTFEQERDERLRKAAAAGNAANTYND